jgi:hypothetical protein
LKNEKEKKEKLKNISPGLTHNIYHFNTLFETVLSQQSGEGYSCLHQACLV